MRNLKSLALALAALGLIGVVSPSRADRPQCVFAVADDPATVDAFEGMSEIPLTPQVLRSIPHWAETYPIVFDRDGRLWLRGNVDDSTVFVLPKAWKALRIRLPNRHSPTPDPEPERRKEPVVDYGVNLGQSSQAVGQIVTNDPALGQVLTGQATEQCPAPAPGPGPVLPDAASSLAGLLLPASILFAAVLVALGFRKRAN